MFKWLSVGRQLTQFAQEELTVIVSNAKTTSVAFTVTRPIAYALIMHEVHGHDRPRPRPVQSYPVKMLDMG